MANQIRSLRMRIGAELKGIFQFSLYLDAQAEPTEGETMESKPALINDIRVMTDTTEEGRRRPRGLMRTYAGKQKVSQAPSQKRGGFVEKEKTQRRQTGNYLSYNEVAHKVITPSAGRDTSNGGSPQKDGGKTRKNMSKIRSLRMRIGAELKGIFQFSLYL